jgi:hypothetical protein
MNARPLVLFAAVLIVHAGLAQTCDQIGHKPGDEGRIQSDFCREWLELHPCKQQEAKPCSEFTFGHIASIAQTLVTGQPLHISIGSLPPQNGFAGGLAFVEHKDFKDEWRLTSDTDAVASGNGSWRAGSYITSYRLPQSHETIGVVMGTPTAAEKKPSVQIAPIFNLYAEATSLNRLFYYGLGPNTMRTAQAAYGLTETIAGASLILPLNRAGLSFTLELNGRVPQLRGDDNETVPSIGQVYTEATAPGLTSQPAFLEPGAGIQIQPDLFNDHLRLHYLFNFQDFASMGHSGYSFRRWSADIGHEFPLARKVYLTAANPENGPDSCTSDPAAPCASPTHVSSTINREGSVSFRLLLTGSATSAGNAVPFYFDPTVGGSDLDSNSILPSYPDYRFRAPSLVLLRGTIEHALPKIPFGAYFSVDAAKAALARSDIDFTRLRQSYSVGLTVHAGGLPVVYLLFAWGGNEGNHTIISVSNVLLGASSRPSLF